VTGGVHRADERAHPKNRFGPLYSAKSATSIRLAHDGREYYEPRSVIDSAEQFLNISAFD
jgi:hypothetical protein